MRVGNNPMPESSQKVIQKIQIAIEDAAGQKENLTRSGWLETSIVRGISKKYYFNVKYLDKNRLFDLCERLLESGNWPERAIAFDWVFRCQRHYEASDFSRFEHWLNRYVVDWGGCDDFCVHAFGNLIFRYPELIPHMMKWTGSGNRWFRRAAAVVLIYSVRKGKHLDAAFQIADRLLIDKDDLVQKGYGWLLKETSRLKPGRVFDYVRAHRKVMPRTSLRYAIEKLTPRLRRLAMEK
jgi:3-methyladenine DNA glycosylase AlkD